LLSFISAFNLIILLIFTGFYLYQAFYVLVSLIYKNEDMISTKNHKYAVVIAARNESNVEFGLLFFNTTAVSSITTHLPMICIIIFVYQYILLYRKILSSTKTD